MQVTTSRIASAEKVRLYSTNIRLVRLLERSAMRGQSGGILGEGCQRRGTLGVVSPCKFYALIGLTGGWRCDK
jgi:hypothetical protein